MPDVTVIPATAADAPLLADIQRRAFARLYALYRDEGSPYRRGEDEILRWLARPDRYVWCIHADGALCGGVTVGILPDGVHYLGRLYVHPARQGLGIATRALALCEAQFPPGARWRLDFPADQPANRRCYEKAGYRDTGRRERVNERLELAIYEK